MAASMNDVGAVRRLTTHVLDLSVGRPAAGVARLGGGRPQIVARSVTNADGRCDPPLLSSDAFPNGIYEIAFEIGDYFARSPGGVADFLDVVPVRFVATPEVAHFHVTLLVSPVGYSKYRGS